MIPMCPKNTVRLWEGFSLLHIMGNGYAHAQDLGAPGSCVRKFSVMPFLFCNLNDVCDFANRNDYSYWLTSNEKMPMSMTPIPAREVGAYISRCSVCEAPTRPIVLHSQSMATPECPGGWEELWVGYSFLMHRDAGAAGGGQALSSPGSCLEEFRARPFIECRSLGTCNFFSTAVSYWLTTIRDNEMFRKPQQQTLKTDFTSRVSRCTVCIRRRVTELAGGGGRGRGHGGISGEVGHGGGPRTPTANYRPDDPASNEIEGNGQGYYEQQRNPYADWRRYPAQSYRYQQQHQQQQQQHQLHQQLLQEQERQQSISPPPRYREQQQHVRHRERHRKQHRQRVPVKQ